MQNANFTPAELIATESFQNWVNRSDPEDTRYWDERLVQHPELQPIAEEAARMIQLLQSLPPQSVPTDKRERVIATVQTEIANRKLSNSPVRRLGLFSFTRVAAAAAIFTAVALTGWWLLNRNILDYQTTYAEIKRVQLPDGSTVVLNAKSAIRLSQNWNTDQPRELWLKGEAFFSVRHTSTHRKFIVHTNDADIEVLGTTFNVYERQNKTRVVLNTGKVKLTNRETASSVIMQPGEMVELIKNRPQPVRKSVNTKLYTAWKDNQLVFDATSLNEIAEMIETNYGYQVVIQDTALRSRQFTYTLKGNDLELLLTALSEAMDVTITQENKIIYINP